MAKKKAPAKSASSSGSKPKAAAKPKASAKKASKPKAAAKKSAPKARARSAGNYTKPELREKLKAEIMAGDKGGHPGQWSARKSQLLASEYKKAGGGYKSGPKAEGQKSLEKWTDEEWTTKDGEKAIQDSETARYLPKKAWSKLTPAQKKATDAKKRKASKTGKQFVANTAKAKKARKSSKAKDS